MKKLLLAAASVLVSTVVFAQTESDPTMTAKYWVDLYRKKNELQNSFVNLGYQADLEIQKIDKLLDTNSLEERLEKLQDQKDECEESFNCSNEEMARLYKEMKKLNVQQELIMAADGFVDAENDHKEWQKRVKQMSLSENQRKNLLDILNRRMELRANQLLVLEGKKTATDEEMRKWDDEFDRLTEALYRFEASQDQATGMVRSEADPEHDLTQQIPYWKSVCASYIAKYKDSPDKKQFVDRIRLELEILNRNYPDIPTGEAIDNPEDKIQIGFDGQGRIVSVNLQ